MAKMTPRERKAAQRARDRAAGWREIIVLVHEDDVPRVRRYVTRLKKGRGMRTPGA